MPTSLKKFHFGYPAKTLGEWLRLAEQNSAPHFMRGFWVGWFSWVFGLLVWPGPHLALPFSLGVVAFMTLAWEWRDYYKADGWDWLDVCFDFLGWLAVQVVHYSTHFWD